MSIAETASTQFVEAASNVRFAYRRFGKQGNVPLVMHIHYRGNMDFWDPLLVNELAKNREVILFDNAGVGRSSGEVPTHFAAWAQNVIAFVRALGLDRIDILGFSMGGMAVIETALAAPDLVRKLVVAGSRPSRPSQQPVAGILWPPEVPDPKYLAALADAVTVEEGRDALKHANFPQTPVASASADAYWARLEKRTIEMPQLTLLPMDKGGDAQVTAMVNADSLKDSGGSDRLEELKMPTLIMNGENDVVVPSSRSWELLKKIKNSQLIIYPRSGHGFLWQYATRVGQDVNRFLDAQDFES